MPRGLAPAEKLGRRGGPAREAAHLPAAHGIPCVGNGPNARRGHMGLHLELGQPQPLRVRARLGAC
eukprot:11194402-Lingulodinium_polyedra.AAC.1